MNEAIELALRKGKYKGVNVSVFSPGDHERAAVLDPLFWQALGKALEWEKPAYLKHVGWRGGQTWLSNWHHFIDWIAEGKDADEFFNQLIRQK